MPWKQSVTLQSNLHVGPPVVSDHLPLTTANPKHQIFPDKALQPEPLVNDHLLYVSDRDRDHFLGLTFNEFDKQFVLTSCKRPLDALSDLYFAVCTIYI